MADDFRIELNSAGVREFLQSGEVAADVGRRAAAIAAVAASGGGQFGHDVRIGKTRARAIVFTADFAAMHAEAKTRALTRAIDAGRA
jgi:hypothetical protein